MTSIFVLGRQINDPIITLTRPSEVRCEESVREKDGQDGPLKIEYEKLKKKKKIHRTHKNTHTK